MIQRKAVSPTPSVRRDLDGVPGAAHFSKPRKSGSQKKAAPGCRELGVRREADWIESKVGAKGYAMELSWGRGAEYGVYIQSNPALPHSGQIFLGILPWSY